jgi:uncharacterized membrane protein YbhN (UPF0104 family)
MAQALQAKISWNHIGLAASVTIISVSAFILLHLLRELNVEAVAEALRATPPRNVMAAVVFVLCAYATLTFYDWFALRMLGACQIPYGVAAFTGATSYAIGHGIGAMVFAAAAIRYRIYSRWGLGVVDVAKMCFLTGLTFWLGNVTAVGLALTFVPEVASAMDQLPPSANRALGVAVLAAVAAYVTWVWQKPRILGRNGWSVTLPAGWLSVLQIAIGLVDLGCCSLVMYLLMPSSPGIDFISLAVIVVCGTLLGFASHAPGAIGILDVAMLIALPSFNSAELVATLLLYRILYFVAPFLLALVAMAAREAYLQLHQDSR